MFESGRSLEIFLFCTPDVTSVTFLVSVPVTVERVGTVSTRELPVRQCEQRNVRQLRKGKKREGIFEETRL